MQKVTRTPRRIRTRRGKKHTSKGQQHPLGIYFKIWGLCSCSPRVVRGRLLPRPGLPAVALILVFMMLKAG
jgi:cytochrome c oxidase subunit IV